MLLEAGECAAPDGAVCTYATQGIPTGRGFREFLNGLYDISCPDANFNVFSSRQVGDSLILYIVELRPIAFIVLIVM